MNRWPQQQRAYDETTSAIESGAKRICVTSPTGTGKSRMMCDLIEWARRKYWRVALYTNRKMLLRQTKNVLESHGIYPGVCAAGYEESDAPVQLCMMQTVASRKLVDDWHHVDEQLVIVDELHNQRGEETRKVFDRYVECGAVLVGYTATPLDIGDLVDELIVAGTVSEGRACGALVPAHTYAPDEPDLASIKKYPIGVDISDADNSSAIMRPGILSRVIDNFNRLNPDRLPTILFGPDVAGSLWFAQHLSSNGIRAAHIDGGSIWIDGESYPADDDMRDALAKESSEGRLPVVCNRFVLREGIDWPWIQCGILATVIGSLTSYLQIGGRCLRKAPGKEHCTIIDHGGNWWRHGSLNADRDWSLGDTAKGEAQKRFESFRTKSEPQPIHCPKCAMIRLSGPKCPKCGFMHSGNSRMVVQVDGRLREIRGDAVKPRKEKVEPQTADLWKKIYYRAKNSKRGMTFGQAYGFFYQEHRYWPPKELAYMPRDPADWNRRVSDVAWEDLIKPEPKSRGA